ncbi:MAG: nicotinate phosphoribosyltransferase [bacterium]
MESERDPHLPWFERQKMALLTDLYELTMLIGYLKTGLHERRVAFEFFFRELPPHSGFAVFAGLEGLIKGIENMSFSSSDLDYLEKSAGFDKEVIDYLADFHPEVDMWAMPEGTVVFPNEPLLRVEGPLAAAQLLETYVLNCLNYPTLVATKAARTCLAALGDPVLEFGLRRAQGPDGGVTGARAAYIGGCAATSNVLAGKTYGIPISGTHAHSWVMSHDTELEAFKAYARVFPDSSLLLVDTYDTLKSGVPNAIKVFEDLRKTNPDVRAAIRIDSGDLARLSKQAHKQLEEAGFKNPRIVGSSDLDEDLIADLKRQGAKINAWGVGTHLITSRDFPALGGVYKIVAVHEQGEWQPRLKVAGNPEKTTDPDRKKVVRLHNGEGYPLADVLCHEGGEEPCSGSVRAVDRERLHRVFTYEAKSAEPLLEKFMEKGRAIKSLPSVDEVKKRAAGQIESLPDEMKRLRNPHLYPVVLTEELGRVKNELINERTGA